MVVREFAGETLGFSRGEEWEDCNKQRQEFAITTQAMHAREHIL
jgi:hypothetical protein